MAFQLPALPDQADVTPGVIDNSSRLTPTTGQGAAQTILRPGRCYVSVSIPALGEEGARAWLAALLRHKTEGGAVRLTWPQPSVVGMPAAALVDGAGQAGSLLSIKGLVAGTTLPALSAFSFIKSGASYLHITSSAVVVDGTGRAVPTLGPLLRTSPADGAALSFASPVIEGDLDPGPLEWSLRRLRWTGINFKITER